jgi:hypothetical protein
MSSLALLVSIDDPPLGPSVTGDSVQNTSVMLNSDWHVATEADIADFKSRFGVGTGDEDPAIVDGFGTGLVPKTEREWDMLEDRLLIFESVESLAALPSSFDLSTNPEFPTVGNQRSQGSCSAWAATYYSYGYLEAVDNGWTEASLGNTEQLLSPAWTYNMVNGGRDSGSWIDTNMMVIVDWGVATLARMPYDDSDATSWGSPEAFREAPLHRALEVGYIDYSPSLTIETIKTLVTEGTPVAFALDANQFTPGFSDGNYIVSSSEYSSTTLNHAQTIVGFDDSVSDDSDTGAFRVVNSWGSDWGDSGYYWFTYDTIKELGSQGILNLNFIVDLEDYAPSLLAVWHFNDSPTRSADISAGLSSGSGIEMEKTPFFDGGEDPRARESFPTFMCLDLTEFSEEYWASSYDMFLSIGDSRETGQVSSFKVEAYETDYEPGIADLASSQSADVPHETPCIVQNRLEYYTPLSHSQALDIPLASSSSSGQASWTGVDHHSSGDGDSMQSGDVSDGGSSVFEVDVEGPMSVSFDWRVSSQSGADSLRFTVDGTMREQISGSTDWARVTEIVGSGSHTLAWLYLKDGSASSLEDCGWLDALELTPEGEILPVIELEPSYHAYVGEPLTVSPALLEVPPGAELTVLYDWGDLSDWTAAYEGDSYTASHTYLAEGEFTLNAYAVDNFGHNVSDDAPVHVSISNEMPSVVGITVTPSGMVSPGVTVVFEVTVTDEEGDELTVSAQFGDGSEEDTLVISSSPGEDEIASFEHAYVSGSDTPFTASFVVSDDAEHAHSNWDSTSVDVLVNSNPVAALAVDSDMGSIGTLFAFDASDTYDAETDPSELLFRYDWTSDDVWDTGWLSNSMICHAYDELGTYEVRMEVVDGAGLTSVAEVTVTVTDDAIPEFSMLIIPIGGMLILAMIALRYERASRRR